MNHQQQQFKISDRVQWTSQAAGHVRKKLGEVVEIVESGARPALLHGGGTPRDHQSYIVHAHKEGERSKHYYWPLVSRLQVQA